MRKSLIPAIALILMSGAAEAAMHHSPYVGLAVGAQMFRHKAQMKQSLVGASWYTDNLNSNKQILAGGVVLGWAFNMGWFHMAPELEYLFGSSSKTTTKTGYQKQNKLKNTVRVSSRGSFNAAIRFGYNYNENLLMYLRGGVEARQFKVSGKGVFRGVGAANEDVTIKNSHSKTRWAPAFGLGVEGKINNDLSLGLEARTAFFKKKNRMVSKRINANHDQDSRMRLAHRANVDTVMLRATYRIGSLFK